MQSVVYVKKAESDLLLFSILFNCPVFLELL